MALTPQQRNDLEVYILEIYKDIFMHRLQKPYIFIEDNPKPPLLWRVRLWTEKEDYDREEDANITLCGRTSFR
jgi:hypothetical protein